MDRSCLTTAVLFACAACHGHPPAVSVTSSTDLGVLRDARAPGLLRDGGAGVLLGGKLLWIFGDTLFAPASVDGANYRSNSAATAELSSPLALSEPLDAKGAPAQFLPFTSEEAAYNAASGRPDERIALWPGHLVPLPDGTALLLFGKLKIHPGVLNYEFLGTGLATVTAGHATAARSPAPIFAAPEPDFSHAAALQDGKLYLFACATIGACRVGRAPLASAAARSAYEFWTGSAWSPELANAAASVPGSTSGFDLGWNASLGRWLSITHPAFSAGAELRTAPAPEGPWSDPVRAFTAAGPIYATYLHPALDTADSQRIHVSYFLPLPNFQGELHVVELTLK